MFFKKKKNEQKTKTIPNAKRSDDDVIEAPEKTFTFNGRQYSDWVEVNGERLFFLGLAPFKNGKCNTNDLDPMCRRIWHGAQYGHKG